ncbi:MAG: SpoIID/LytB domain-containing protein, partial [Kamptonema sp. SIO1D9]|nr:SpoIID/LytB domain-containing protein [Kamptonema sp. SIO1D9]
GTVKAITAERTTPRGRVVTMKVIGDRATKILSGSEIRQALGLRSTLFTVSSNGSNFQISGRGFGHGVGLSQWGAKNLAQQGLGYQQILSHYYQNTILAKLN